MDLSALRALSPEELTNLIAERRAERGIRWLEQKAPPCWHRNFFNPMPGNGSMFRARNAYGTECALALAFETRADLANKDGEVSDATVVRAFNLSDEWLRSHGFGGLRPGKIESAILDRAWEKLMRIPRPEWRRPYQHPRRLQLHPKEQVFFDPPDRLFGPAIFD